MASCYRGTPEASQEARATGNTAAQDEPIFAVDQKFEGQGLKRLLLSYALRTVYRASQDVASAFVLLGVVEDASGNAVGLYLRAGFTALPSNPHRMLLPMREIGRVVGSQ